jgi:hypothetical protein
LSRTQYKKIKPYNITAAAAAVIVAISFVVWLPFSCGPDEAVSLKSLSIDNVYQ